jgi:hypothetical protein
LATREERNEPWQRPRATSSTWPTASAEINERIIDSSKQAGEVTLSAYAKTLGSIAELQENVGKASQLDWLTTFATAQANFTRDLAEAYTDAARKLVK